MTLPKHFGVARGWPAAAGRPGASAPSAPAPSAPVLLPAISAPRACVLSPYLLVAGYAGPTLQLARAGDGATLDVYPVAGGQAPDLSAVSAWANGAALAVAALYDQTGAGFHHTQATAAKRPPFSLGSGLIRGKYPVVFDSTASGAIKGLGNASLVIDRRNSGWQGAVAVMSDGMAQYPRTFGSSDSNAAQFVANGSTSNNFRFKVNTSAGAANRVGRSGVQSLGMILSASGATIELDGPTATVGALASGSAGAGSWIGTCYADFAQKSSDISVFADIVYGATPSQADYDADRAVLNQVFDIDTAYVDALFCDGDSITAGTAATYGANIWRQLEPLLSRRVGVFNFAVPGQTAQTLAGAQAQANSTTIRSFAQITGRKVLFLMAGVNDIRGSETPAATLWGSYLLPRIQFELNAGCKVVVGTVTPNNWGATDADAKEAIRQAVNASIRQNAATYGYGVADFDTVTPFTWGDAPTNLHPDSATYGRMAQVVAPLVNAALAG